MNIPLERHVTVWSDSMQTIYMHVVMDNHGDPQIWAFSPAPQHPPKIPPRFLCFEKCQKVTFLSQILHMLQSVNKC